MIKLVHNMNRQFEVFKIRYLIIFLFPIYISGCAVTKKIDYLTGWVVYWDVEKGLKEINRHIDLYDQINVFAADFTSDGNLAFPPGFEELLHGVIELSKKSEKKIFITIVNDVRGNNITGSKLKDPDVIHKILNSSELMEKHIEQLTKLSFEKGVHGIDIDYENLFPEDIDAFYLFINKLATRLRNNGKEIELTLEPGRIKELQKIKRMSKSISPTFKINIMGYNLHYPPQTEPGPRATPLWLSSLSRSAIAVSRNYTWAMALATHGFEWDKGEGRSISLEEVKKLLKGFGIKPKRARDSHVPHFKYIDRQGNQRTVWYEDEESFTKKWAEVSKRGITQLTLWRIGRNSSSLYRFIEQFKVVHQNLIPIRTSADLSQ